MHKEVPMRVPLLLIAPALLVAGFAPAPRPPCPPAHLTPAPSAQPVEDETPVRGEQGLYVGLVGLGIAAVVILVALSARARRERTTPGAAFEERFSWKALAPVPAEVRALMRQAAQREDFPHDLLASCAAECADAVSKQIKRVRR
jgi:hypothetical protein